MKSNLISDLNSSNLSASTNTLGKSRVRDLVAEALLEVPSKARTSAPDSPSNLVIGPIPEPISKIVLSLKFSEKGRRRFPRFLLK